MFIILDHLDSLFSVYTFSTYFVNLILVVSISCMTCLLYLLLSRLQFHTTLRRILLYLVYVDSVLVPLMYTWTSPVNWTYVLDHYPKIPIIKICICKLLEKITIWLKLYLRCSEWWFVCAGSSQGRNVFGLYKRHLISEHPPWDTDFY